MYKIRVTAGDARGVSRPLPVRYPAPSGLPRVSRHLTPHHQLHCTSLCGGQGTSAPSKNSMSLLSRLPRDAGRLVLPRLPRDRPRYVTISAIGPRNERLNRYLEVSEEVRSAIARKVPVVALESAIITHGGAAFSQFDSSRYLTAIVVQDYLHPTTLNSRCRWRRSSGRTAQFRPPLGLSMAWQGLGCREA